MKTALLSASGIGMALLMAFAATPYFEALIHAVCGGLLDAAHWIEAHPKYFITAVVVVVAVCVALIDLYHAKHPKDLDEPGKRYYL